MVRSQPRRGEQLNFAGFLLNPIGQLRTTPLASQCLVVPSSYREYNADEVAPSPQARYAWHSDTR